MKLVHVRRFVPFFALLACTGQKVATAPTQPATTPTPIEVRIWPGAVPNPQPVATPEGAITIVTDSPVAGRPWTSEINVATPTMTVYPAQGTNSGAAVVVFPGGGYRKLAIDLEGTEVCDWLTPLGVTCVLLKYRVPDSGPHWDSACDCEVTPEVPRALQDAQRTIGLLRTRAAELHLDPHKIGVLGFSAGGHLVAAVSTHFDARAYPVVDAADRESCRPDFAVALYPGHLWKESAPALNPDIATHITDKTPPTLLIQATDDPVDDVRNSVAYFTALKAAGVPVEMHLFAKGGHAFGLRRTKFAITGWTGIVEAWLRAVGAVSG